MVLTMKETLTTRKLKQSGLTVRHKVDSDGDQYVDVAGSLDVWADLGIYISHVGHPGRIKTITVTSQKRTKTFKER